MTASGSAKKANARFGAAGGAAAGGIVIVDDDKKEDKSTLKKILDFFQALTFFIVVAAAAFAISYGIIAQTYRLGLETGHNSMGGQKRGAISSNTAIVVPDPTANDWIPETKLSHVVARKIDSVTAANTIVGNPADHILLGIFERDKAKRPREAGLHFYIAAANGHPDGVRLFKGLNLPVPDVNYIRDTFDKLHEINGDEGLLRLGQYYLGDDAFKIEGRMETSLRYGRTPGFEWPTAVGQTDQAFKYFHKAALCDLALGFEWRSEMAQFYKFAPDRRENLRQQGNDELKDLAKRYGGEQDQYCKRLKLQKAIDKLKEKYLSNALVKYADSLADWNGETNPCELEVDRFSPADCDVFEQAMRSNTFSAAGTLPTFEMLIDDIIKLVNRKKGKSGGGSGDDDDDSRITTSSGSQAYRNAPAANSFGNIETEARDGLPGGNARGAPRGGVAAKCDFLRPGEECVTREDALECSDRAQREFKLGEADMAIGRVVGARVRFNRALSVGRPCQSEYAELAAKRLAALNLTCEYTPESLARIGRDYDLNPSGGALVDIASRQRALKAKGYYEADIDGRYGSGTRAAVRMFQREIGFSETGDLTPIETVYLICSAAQVNADPKSINLLGIMYIAGLGVVQNTDAGLRFLKQAAQRGYPDAKFNLALVYGTRTINSSYELCDVVENIQQADAYLVEAANAGSIPAQRLVNLFETLTPDERWANISAELEKNDFYGKRLQKVGEACRPN
ncbi:MAG: peptidoglycan-binding protein [Pseudomonadota bacterium]